MINPKLQIRFSNYSYLSYTYKNKAVIIPFVCNIPFINVNAKSAARSSSLACIYFSNSFQNDIELLSNLFEESIIAIVILLIIALLQFIYYC